MASQSRSPRSERIPEIGGGAARRATHARQVPGVQPASRAHSEVGMNALVTDARSNSTLKRSARKAAGRCFMARVLSKTKTAGRNHRYLAMFHEVRYEKVSVFHAKDR